MSANRTCPHCGTALAPDTLEGLCPRCVGRSAFADAFAADDADEAARSPEIDAELVRLKPEEPGERIGTYKLMEQIGQGGFGAVWVADQEKPVRRRVAVKIIKLGMDTKEVIARFEQERQALALMDHPHIARVFDAGATQFGRPYFAMELVRGIRITDYCDQANLPTADRLKLFVQVCHAVQHAHQKGIIHRDLKPSNILVTLHDGEPVPKIIDFGVAKATQQQRLTDLTIYTQFQQMIGTPLYMSPEQAEMSGLDIDTRSDIYSLGVLLYELLTGRTPFDPGELMSKGLDEIRRTIREVEPQTPSIFLKTMPVDSCATVAQRRQTDPVKLAKLVRGDLDWIVMKALEKDRSRRYETANGLALDIQRHLANEPVLARPASQLYRARRWVRRNKLAFAAAAAVTVALLAGAAFSTWSFLREQDQRREADGQRNAAKANAAQAVAHERRARRLLYGANLQLAQQALHGNNRGYARRLLDLHWPAPGEEDLRGFEWRYLWEQCRDHGLSVLARHTTGISSVSYSADGRHLALGGFDGRVELWQVAPRRLVKVLHESTGGAARVVFSPTAAALAATAGEGTVKWHDLTAGTERVLCQTPGPVRDLAISDDGTQLAIRCSKKSCVVLVGTAGGTVARTIELPPGPGGYFNNVRFSPDGARLYVSGGAFEQPTLRCLELPEGKLVWEQAALKLDGRRNMDGFSAMALSRDGRFLVTGTGYQSGLLEVWQAADGKRVAALEGHTAWICQLTFSRDGQWLASAASDQTIRLWNTRTWESAEPLRGNSDEVHSVAFSPDGAWLASGSKDGVAMLWDLTAIRRATGPVALPVHVTSVRALPGGRTIAAASAIRGWSLIELETLRETPLVPDPAVPARFTPPNFLGIYDGTERLEVREIGESETRSLGFCRVGKKFGHFFVYDSAARRVAWCEPKGGVRIGSLDDAAQIELHGDDDRLAHVTRFSADGRFLMAVDGGGAPTIWEIATRRRVPAAERHLSPRGFTLNSFNSVRGAGLSAWLTAAVSPATLERSRLPEPAATRAFWPPMGWTSRAFSSDGHTSAVSANSGVVGLYDVRRPAWHTRLHGQLHSVFGVAFSTDGRRLVSTGDGAEAVKMWDVDTQQELLTLAGYGTFLDGVEFTDDDNTLIVGSDRKAGSWQFWRAPSLREIEAVEHSGGGWTRGN